VTYDIDGNREGLIDGQTGFAIAPFDQKRFGEALEVLLADGPRRRQMGEAGRQFAMKRFGADVMVEALERVYSGTATAGVKDRATSLVPSSGTPGEG